MEYEIIVSVPEEMYSRFTKDVKITRCKDCKWWHREIYNGVEYFNFNSCDLNHCGDGNSFYCADAERKEE